MKIPLLTTLALGLVLSVWISGCVNESTSPIVGSGDINTVKPMGTITGKIFDGCTNKAISGARMSVGYSGTVQSTLTDASGSFSFANVPAGQYQVPGGPVVTTGTYTLTASLVDYNSAQTDSLRKYRDYYYNVTTLGFTSLVAPKDSSGVSGLVAHVVFTPTQLNTTMRGTVVDKNQQPLAGALVRLFDLTVTPGTVIGQTVTGANGEYQFANVDNGITVTVTARSSDGTLQGTLPAPYTFPCNSLGDSLRAQVAVENIVAIPADNVAPYVISITPENNADLSQSSLQIVYTFSEPIKQKAYTRTDLGLGYGTIMDDIVVTYVGLKKVAGATPFTASWDPTYTRFTVIPQGLVGSAKYQVNAWIGLGKLTDQSGLTVVNNTSIVGDFEALNFTTSGGSTVPAAPVLARRSVPGVFGPLDYTGGTVGLEWNYDANARSYHVYRSINGGSFDRLASNIQFTQLQTNSGPLYAGTFPNPLGPASVSYKVTGVSKDLVEGSASIPVAVTDNVRPRLIYFPAPAAAPGTNNWVYTVGFSEPMSQAATENIANYTFSTFGGVSYSINSATYAGYDGTRWIVYLNVTSSGPPVAGYALTTTNAIVDLVGNSMDTAFNSHTY